MTPELMLKPNTPSFEAIAADNLEIRDFERVRLEAPRYLFFIGDVLTAAFKRDRPENEFAQRGGEDVSDIKTIRRTKNILPACWITPMEETLDWMPVEYVPEGVRTKQLATRPEDALLYPMSLYSPVNMPNPNAGVPMLPGDQIKSLMNLPADARKGIVELKSLADVDMRTGKPQEIHNYFFPDDYELPILLEERVARIKKVRDEFVHFDEITSVASDMIESANQFSVWAHRLVEICHNQIRQGREHQHTYSYSPVILTLLPQLGLARQDSALQLLASQQTKLTDALSSKGVTAEDLQVMQKQNAEALAMISNTFAEALASLKDVIAKTNQPERKKKVDE